MSAENTGKAETAAPAAEQPPTPKTESTPPAAPAEPKADAKAAEPAGAPAPADSADPKKGAPPARPSVRMLGEVARREKLLREREQRARTEAVAAQKAMEEAKALREQASRMDGLRGRAKTDPWGVLRELGVSDADTKNVFDELTRGAMAGGKSTPEAEVARLRHEIEEKERAREQAERARQEEQQKEQEAAVQADLDAYFAGIDHFVASNAANFPLTAALGRGSIRQAAVEYARSHGGVAATPEELAPLVEQEAAAYLESQLVPTPWFAQRLKSAAEKAVEDYKASLAAAKAPAPAPKTTTVPNAVAPATSPEGPKSTRDYIREAVRAAEAKRAVVVR